MTLGKWNMSFITMDSKITKLDKLKQTKKTVEYELEDNQYNQKRLKLKDDTVSKEIDDIQNEIIKLEYEKNRKDLHVYSDLLKTYFVENSFILDGATYILDKFVSGTCDIYPRCTDYLQFSGWCNCCRYKNYYDVCIDENMIKHTLTGNYNYDLSFHYYGEHGLSIKITNVELLFTKEYCSVPRIILDNYEYDYPKKIVYTKEATFYFTKIK